MRRLLLAAVMVWSVTAVAQKPVVWRFDNVTSIGGLPVTTIGSPKLVDTDLGKAIHFEGKGEVGDALYVDTLPLTGTLPYTWEVVFRPSSAGTPTQRFFHLQEAASQSRRMFELRIIEGKWCLDSFATNTPAGEPAPSAVILKCDVEHLHPLDQWYAIAAVYDGTTLRSYVNGVLQGEAPVKLSPLGKGGTSIGTRYNKKDFFTGDVFSARFTSEALSINKLLQLPRSHP
jgi:hypothetical protein